MKKELNGKSRRKFVVGGAMVFGSIALLSTGFATWVIGAVNNSATGDLTVSIDTVKNESLTVTADVKDGAIKIADPANTTGLVHTGQETGRDLEFKVELTAKFSEDYGMVGAVIPSFVAKNDVAGNKIAKTTIDSLHIEEKWATSRGEIEGDYYSIFADAITVKEGQDMDTGWSSKGTATNGVFTCTRTITYVLDIGDIWGSSKTFCGLVNTIYADQAATADATVYGKIETEMEKELEAIENNFANGKIQIKLEVAKESSQG